MYNYLQEEIKSHKTHYLRFALDESSMCRPTCGVTYCHNVSLNLYWAKAFILHFCFSSRYVWLQRSVNVSMVSDKISSYLCYIRTNNFFRNSCCNHTDILILYFSSKNDNIVVCPNTVLGHAYVSAVNQIQLKKTNSNLIL